LLLGILIDLGFWAPTTFPYVYFLLTVLVCGPLSNSQGYGFILLAAAHSGLEVKKALLIEKIPNQLKIQSQRLPLSQFWEKPFNRYFFQFDE